MPLVAGLPFVALDNDPSELVAAARPGRGPVLDRGVTQVTAAIQLGDCALVAGAIVVANGSQNADLPGKPQILVGPARQAVVRSRRW